MKVPQSKPFRSILSYRNYKQGHAQDRHTFFQFRSSTAHLLLKGYCSVHAQLFQVHFYATEVSHIPLKRHSMSAGGGNAGVQKSLERINAQVCA